MSDKLPDCTSLESVLVMMFGNDVIVRERDSTPDVDKCIVGFYLSNENEPRRAVVCDLELACGSGAALSRISVHMAKEAAKSGDIPENVLANFSEVLNVYMSLLEGAMSERVVLGDVVVPGAAKPDELNWGVLKSPKDTANFEVDLGSYGMRSISVLAL